MEVHYRVHNSPPLVRILSHILYMPFHPISIRHTLILPSFSSTRRSYSSGLLAQKCCIHCSPTFVLHVPPRRSGNAFIKHNRIFLYCHSTAHNAVLSVNSTQCCTARQQHKMPCCQSTAHNPVLSVNRTQYRSVSQQHTILYCQSKAHKDVLSVNSTQCCTVS